MDAAIAGGGGGGGGQNLRRRGWNDRCGRYRRGEKKRTRALERANAPQNTGNEPHSSQQQPHQRQRPRQQQQTRRKLSQTQVTHMKGDYGFGDVITGAASSPSGPPAKESAGYRQLQNERFLSAAARFALAWALAIMIFISLQLWDRYMPTLRQKPTAQQRAFVR